MPFVQFVVTTLACCVEDFPAKVDVEGGEPRDFKRSCEGALHIRPGASAEVTADELEHLRKNHPSVFAATRILVSDEQLEASRAAPTEQPPPPEVPEVPNLGSDEGSGGGSSDESDEADSKPKRGKRG